GVSLALDSGRADRLLLAAERWRAGSLVVAAVPPPDPVLAELLDRFRSASARRREAPGPESDVALAAIEAQVRDRTRARRGTADARDAVPPLVLGDLAARLGDRALVEWVVHRGQLHAVTVCDGRVRSSHLGPVQPALDAVASVRMCLHRLARGVGSARSLAAAWTTLEVAAKEAADALFGPILSTLDERELVLVPTGVLHGVPWLALDVVRRVPVVVAPSARAWLAADGRSRRGGLLLAAGPDLPGAAAEVAALAATLPDGVLLDPEHANVGAVLGALGSVGVAHLAAHGRFRTDNPQFSSLRFADGELTVYDLEALTHVPDVLVLSACDAASAAVRPGDELLGLSSALLALGAGSLVAPSVPVPDDATVAPMVLLQGELAGGSSARTALWQAVRAWDDAGAGTPADHQVAAAVRSFVALGA
ncbi:MAG: Tetratricopeptide repeat protein 28, partial [Nocardioidaceae bacterium]|nr:Tetratricopeptide repeat protein 28 [Nocardioidaceae bacterium]